MNFSSKVADMKVRSYLLIMYEKLELWYFWPIGCLGESFTLAAAANLYDSFSCLCMTLNVL